MINHLHTQTFSLEEMVESVRKIKWLQYEVDPSWSGFCEFGPEDIGGVWEKLGVIRKRSLPDALFVSNDLRPFMDKVHKQLEKEIICGPSELPAYFSPYLPPGTAIALQNPFPERYSIDIEPLFFPGVD